MVMPESSVIYRLIAKYALRKADMVTSVAEHMTNLMLKRKYVRKKEVVTFPFGIDIKIFNLNARHKKHCIEEPIIVSTRNLDKGLDVHLFIQAIPKVIRYFPKAKFVVAGDGPYKEELQRMAINFGVDTVVDFIGKISHSDMPSFLGGADVYVSTSRSDGSSVSLNEAMACGAFPIATDIAANREWIEHTKNGLLFSCFNPNSLAEKIINCLMQPDWRDAVMPMNWKIASEKASWESAMNKMEIRYNQLLK